MRGKVKLLGFLCIWMCITAHGEVSTRVLLRDCNELLMPVDSNAALQYVDYGQIMVGTQLAIVIESNAIEFDKIMGLYTEDYDPNFAGELLARGDEMMGYPDSIFDAAGKSAMAWIYWTEGLWGEENENKHYKGFDLYTGYADVNTGDWFIIDYNAVTIGDCNVAFYWWEPPPANPDHGLIHELWFSHVPTRDFNADGQVDFADFSVLAGYWFDSNCVEPNSCQGVNLDNYGLVDTNDLALFADYWLEKTK